MTKQERAKKAQAHYEDVKERLAAETQQSILLTTTYEPNSFINRKDRDYHENTSISKTKIASHAYSLFLSLLAKPQF